MLVDVTFLRHDRPPTAGTCPVCGSRALTGPGAKARRSGEKTWVLSCGACRTSRAYTWERGTRRARAQVRRQLRRERRRMRRALHRAEVWGIDFDLQRLIASDLDARVRSGAAGDA